MGHLLDSQSLTHYQVSDRQMDCLFESNGAWVVNGNDPLKGILMRQTIFRQDLVYGFYREISSVFFEHPMTIWAGDNHFPDAISGEEIFHIPEHGGEILVSAKIMRDLHAAIEDDPQSGETLLHMLIKLERLVRPGARKIAAREKYRIAPCWDGVVSITF